MILPRHLTHFCLAAALTAPPCLAAGSTTVPDSRGQVKYDRESPELLQAWMPVMEKARASTTRVLENGTLKAHACAVHPDGWLVTKASEIKAQTGKSTTTLEVVFPDGLRLPAKLSDRYARYDLALLKVNAKGLTPVEWDTTTALTPGTFLASVQPDSAPLATGVLSVGPRSLDNSQKGYLGVGLEACENELGTVKIKSIHTDTPASRGGLSIGDVVTEIAGRPMKTVTQCIEAIAACPPFMDIKIKVVRDKKEQEFTLQVGTRPAGVGTTADDPRNTLSGALSKTRAGFPEAFSHDMVLEPEEVGGPVIDLHGRILGMNIARSGRIESLAIPSAEMKRLLSSVSQGQLYHPELDTLKAQRQAAEALIEQTKKEIDALRTRIKEAEEPAPTRSTAEEEAP